MKEVSDHSTAGYGLGNVFARRWFDDTARRFSGLVSLFGFIRTTSSKNRPHSVTDFSLAHYCPLIVERYLSVSVGIPNCHFDPRQNMNFADDKS